MVLRRLLNAGAMPATSPTYWRLMRYMLFALLVAACGVGGVFLSLAMRWQNLAAVCGLVAIGGIGSVWLLMLTQTANVFLWHRPDASAGCDSGKADVGRRMSSGRPISPSELSMRLESKGQLHDCAISIKWVRGLSDRLVIHIDDIDANFRGLPEYRGKRSGELTFLDAREIEGSFAEGERKVYEAIVEGDGERGRVTLRFWPHGALVASFLNATLIESDRL